MARSATFQAQQSELPAAHAPPPTPLHRPLWPRRACHRLSLSLLQSPRDDRASSPRRTAASRLATERSRALARQPFQAQRKLPSNAAKEIPTPPARTWSGVFRRLPWLSLRRL